MSQTLKCDLCGCELTNEEKTIKQGFLGIGENKPTSKNRIVLNERAGDLCSDCYKQIDEFIKYLKENRK